jgi:hypothetical protein
MTAWQPNGHDPNATARTLADAAKALHDPVAVAQRVAEAREARDARRLAAIMASMEGDGDPRTSAEKIAGALKHDAAYDDRRAKHALPAEPPGPREKLDEQPPQSLADALRKRIEQRGRELGLPDALVKQMLGTSDGQATPSA